MRRDLASLPRQLLRSSSSRATAGLTPELLWRFEWLTRAELPLLCNINLALGMVNASVTDDRGADCIAWVEGCSLTPRNGQAIALRLNRQQLGAGSRLLVSSAATGKAELNAELCAPASFVPMPGIAYRLTAWPFATHWWVSRLYQCLPMIWPVATLCWLVLARCWSIKIVFLLLMRLRLGCRLLPLAVSAGHCLHAGS